MEIEFSTNDNEEAEADGNETETEPANAQSDTTTPAPVGRIQGPSKARREQGRVPLNTIIVTHSQIMRLFGHAGLRDLFTNHRGLASGNPPDDDDDEVEDGYAGTRRRRRAKGSRGRYPPVPSEEGKRLMTTGTFGETGSYEDKLRNRKERLATRLMYRELGIHADSSNRTTRLASQACIPEVHIEDVY